MFRPLSAPRRLPTLEVRQDARDLVHRHGTDTLAYFKLRRDQHYLFSADRRAFLGYRVEAGVLLVSGDPVGPAESGSWRRTQNNGMFKVSGLTAGDLSSLA